MRTLSKGEFREKMKADAKKRKEQKNRQTQRIMADAGNYSYDRFQKHRRNRKKS